MTTNNQTDQQITQEAYANLPNEHCTILQDHADLHTDGVATVTSAEVGQCTNEMRWLDRVEQGQLLVNCDDPTDVHQLTAKAVITLQQKWISNSGEVEYRDVPTVQE